MPPQPPSEPPDERPDERLGEWPDAPSGASGPEGPTFDAAQALQQLQRALREQGLLARGPGFERRGRRVAELVLEGQAVQARLARRPALTPEWDRSSLRSAVEQRQWLQELARRLTRWERDDD